MDDELISTDEAADILGVQPQSVRSLLARYGVKVARGYWRSEIEGLKRTGQGRRTDLEAEGDT